MNKMNIVSSLKIKKNVAPIREIKANNVKLRWRNHKKYEEKTLNTYWNFLFNYKHKKIIWPSDSYAKLTLNHPFLVDQEEERRTNIF